ncbi:hypothetical protein GCM10009828_071350 [Actinoplanes couchii]|uniref:Uncharacterized protein n=1 Tax=Actinoplanes couchii TaxID=403638 RepID=A0ABQ3X6H0_9ACTN|nr:hypothetical protein Aco03nite_024040 [Actinoplanes couchii]
MGAGGEPAGRGVWFHREEVQPATGPDGQPAEQFVDLGEGWGVPQSGGEMACRLHGFTALEGFASARDITAGRGGIHE